MDYLKPTFQPKLLVKSFVKKKIIKNRPAEQPYNDFSILTHSRQEIFIRHYLHKAWTFCLGYQHLNTGPSMWLHLNNISPMMSTLYYLLFNPQKRPRKSDHKNTDSYFSLYSDSKHNKGHSLNRGKDTNKPDPFFH